MVQVDLANICFVVPPPHQKFKFINKEKKKIPLVENSTRNKFHKAMLICISKLKRSPVDKKYRTLRTDIGEEFYFIEGKTSFGTF